MAKYLNAMQRRNNDKIAKSRRMASCASYASEETKRRFKTPAYQTKKNVHAN